MAAAALPQVITVAEAQGCMLNGIFNRVYGRAVPYTRCAVLDTANASYTSHAMLISCCTSGPPGYSSSPSTYLRAGNVAVARLSFCTRRMCEIAYASDGYGTAFDALCKAEKLHSHHTTVFFSAAH